MNKKLFLTLTAGLIALLTACSDNIVDANGSNPVDTSAKLTIILQDIVTEEVKDGISVTLMSTNKTVKSKNGRAVFENVRVGDHWVRVEGAGYAKTISQVTVDGDGNQGVYIAQETIEQIDLYPLTGTVTGYVYATDKEQNDLPAKEIELVLTLGYPFVNNTFTATTEADGSYTFENLPAGASFDIDALETEIGDLYYARQGVASDNVLKSGITNLTAPSVITESSIFQVLSWTDQLAYKDSAAELKVVFTSAIDKTKLTTTSFQVGSNPIQVSISSDGKTATLKTQDARWIGASYNGSAPTYSIDCTVTSKTGKTTSCSGVTGKWLQPDLAGKKPGKPVLANASGVLTVNTACVEGANGTAGYYIYAKEDTAPGYGAVVGETTACGQVVTTTYSLSADSKHNVMVRARNSTSLSDFSDVETITIAP